ncbi:MAG: 1-deoxy-D-xylulose-5-phosphate synthase [Bacteroidia bacterium]|nr:1-deoxy-D-xylulose-5-phosphate synthase [Bacteroidia bacterium]NNF30754.1 1-deoxy-D-xylulose-5-phosphate synthase [Flavobacteriaceae bacterium]MBT8277201.1 1-deoxy-D-xylulose-5-phosphate synthase [Bacteroidia bacterium]NNJ81452.1 1-deoxy-D-xylulose-5-phosphate synthase [Flavobacteriaceae bacterium]NNK54778.1 1-deoxy-D-xylulose-5-phosphate synthase [Flavobacteriaceae bacterium]
MSNTLLDSIQFPSDLRKLQKEKLPQLAAELRDFVIHIVAAKEGHLGASLGVVELTIALHYVFNTPDDQLVWDVGHQAYGHKILTGRRDQFQTNRKLGGLSGFPRREESEYDTFGTGHSSTAISAALGMAIAAQLTNAAHRQHIAVVGDASIASGMAFEALNHAGVTNTNLLVILNDNAIGIDPSVGSLKDYLTKVTLDNAPDTDNIFEALNFKYSGPLDGHDIDSLVSELERLKNVEGPKLLHIITTKGKGLRQAEVDQVKYHAPGKFDAKTGDLFPRDTSGMPPKFQDVFGKSLVELARKNEKIVGITPAMPTGSSLKYMMDVFPTRAFDVGIAEQHAVTFAAGLATQGMVVFCNIYSTFLQRAYDQVIHDVCLQDLPVIFCLDRAGIVGEDGATHHGIFDLAYLRCVPNLILAAPSNEIELRNLLYTAQLGLDHPIAIRYPRGRGNIVDWRKEFTAVEIGKGQMLKEGSEIAILSIGNMAINVTEAISGILENEKIGHFDMCFVKPLDDSLLHEIFGNYHTVITIEDGVAAGGFGSAVAEFAAGNSYKNNLRIIGIQDEFPEHGSVEELHHLAGISSDKIREVITSLL